MRLPQPAKDPAAFRSEPCLDVAPILLSPRPRHEAGALETVDSAREAAGTHHYGRREVAHPQPAVPGLGELGENVEVAQAGPVRGAELLVKPRRQPRVGAQEPLPGF